MTFCRLFLGTISVGLALANAAPAQFLPSLNPRSISGPNIASGVNPKSANLLKNINQSYLGGMTGRMGTMQMGSMGQMGLSGFMGMGGQYGQSRSSGQMGLYGSMGTGGAIGMGGKPSGGKYGQVGGAGQFGSRYGL